MRAVVDVNVLLSALMARDGAPASIVRAWTGGEFEMVVSPLLVDELKRAATYPKLSRRIAPGAIEFLVDLMTTEAVRVEDPEEPPPVRSADPGDDYLIALAAAASAVLVSGDRHLLDLAGRIPVFSPSQFVDLLGTD